MISWWYSLIRILDIASIAYNMDVELLSYVPKDIFILQLDKTIGFSFK